MIALSSRAVATLLVLTLTACAATTPPAPEPAPEAALDPAPVEFDVSGKAEAIAALLAGEEFWEVHERFGKLLQSALPLSQLSRSWQSVVREAVTASPPPYADPGTFDEHEVLVGEGEHALPGTLTLPVSPGPVPAVVLVHGSGPSDRDSSLGPNKPVRDLAWGLASRGVAVLRYEKRTRQHPSAFAALGESYTVREEVIDDALAAVASLRGASEANCGYCAAIRTPAPRCKLWSSTRPGPVSRVMNRP